MTNNKKNTKNTWFVLQIPLFLFCDSQIRQLPIKKKDNYLNPEEFDMFKTILKTAVLSAITITFLSACGAATRALNGAANNAVNLALQDAEKRYLGNIEEIIDENGNTIQVTLDENGKRIQVSTDDNGNPILIASTAPPTPNNEVLYVHVHGKNHPASWQVNYDDKAGISCVERNSFCSVNGFDSRIPEYQFFTWDTAKATYAGNVKGNYTL